MGFGNERIDQRTSAPNEVTLRELMGAMESRPGLTLEEFLLTKMCGRIHPCPKCDKKGYIEESFNAYPPGLPDSSYVYRKGIKLKDCDLCKNYGYTEVKYTPKTEMKVVGYEAE
jgi:hypothetical protein